MRRVWLTLALFVACDEAPNAPVGEVPPPMERPVIAASSTTTTVAATPPTLPASQPAKTTTITKLDRGAAAKRSIVRRRREVRDDLRRAIRRLGALEAKLEQVGGRDQRRELLRDIGKARSAITEAKRVERRCEAAFDSDMWDEVQSATPDEHLRTKDLVEEMHEECKPLPLLEGRPKRF